MVHSTRTGWKALGIVLALTVAACSDGPTDLGNPPVDDGVVANPQAVVQTMGVLSSTLESEQFKSLEALDKSAAFDGLTGQVASITAALTRSAAGSGEPQTELGNSLAAFDGASYSALIPPDVFGTTFEWDPSTNGYANLGRPGAPANGMRVILYIMDPATGIPMDPIFPVGYLEIVVTSKMIGAVVVGPGSQVMVAYEFRVTGPTTMQVEGFVSDGTFRIDLLALYEETVNDPQPMFEECAAMAYVGLCAGTGFTLDITISMNAPPLQLHIDYSFFFGESGWVITTESSYVQDGQLLSTVKNEYFEAVGPFDYIATFDVTFLVDGVVVGSIDATGGDVVFTGVGGVVLTADELAAVSSFYRTPIMVIQAFGEMVAPVTALTGLPMLLPLPPLGGGAVAP